jgi:hypothetical protein
MKTKDLPVDLYHVYKQEFWTTWQTMNLRWTFNKFQASVSPHPDLHGSYQILTEAVCPQCRKTLRVAL